MVETIGASLSGSKRFDPVCPLWAALADENRVFAPLGEICDLLFDAGAHVPFEGCSERETLTGVPRLLQLLDLYTNLEKKDGEKKKGGEGEGEQFVGGLY